MNPEAADLPEDIEDFWREAVAEANAHPLYFRRSASEDFGLTGFHVQTLCFSVPNGRMLNGWIAYPEGARRLRSFLWIPPYGRESSLPNHYSTRDGFVSMSFNFFGEPAFHQEKYLAARGYLTAGAEAPETWVFRRMLQDAVIAAKVLQAQSEVDEERVGAMGMSQGGGMAIWLGAWCAIVKAVCADMPFLGNVAQTLTQPVYRYPMKELADLIDELPLGLARVLNTLSYFDTANQARFCRAPTQVSLGLKDPAARPENVRDIFEALPGPKILRTYDWGHDWFPPMIENNRRWLLDNLR
jgi:cephalosporin-C deacetylase